MTELNHAEVYHLMRDHDIQIDRWRAYAIFAQKPTIKTRRNLKETLSNLQDKIYEIFHKFDDYSEADRGFIKSFGWHCKLRHQEFPHFKFYLNGEFIFERYDMGNL